jgi:hypothetical protein
VELSSPESAHSGIQGRGRTDWARRAYIDVMRYRTLVLLLTLAVVLVGVLSACGGSGGGY